MSEALSMSSSMRGKIKINIKIKNQQGGGEW